MKRSRLAAKSEKQRVIDAERAALKLTLLDAAGVIDERGASFHACAGRLVVPEVVCASPWPRRPRYEMHEVVKRSRSRSSATDPDVIVLLCQFHHDWTEAEPTKATVRGLLSSAANVHPFDKFDAYDPEGER